MGYFYWAAAEIFAKDGHEDLLPEVAAGFEEEALRLAESALPDKPGTLRRRWLAAVKNQAARRASQMPLPR